MRAEHRISAQAASPGGPTSPRSARGVPRGAGALAGGSGRRYSVAPPRAAASLAAEPLDAPPLYPHLLPVLDFVAPVRAADVARALAAGLLAAAAALLLLSPRAAAAAGRAPPPARAALAAAAALGCALAAALLAAAREAAAQAVLLSPTAAADADSLFGPRSAALPLHYKLRRPSGTAPCHVIVACLHGMGANESSFTLRGAASGLADRARAAVLASDAPGFGLTPRPAAVVDYGLARSAQAVNALVDDIATDADVAAPGARRVLLGHSLGGLLAVRAAWDAAARRTPYDALVLVAPAVLPTKAAARAVEAATAALRDAKRGVPAAAASPKPLPLKLLSGILRLVRSFAGVLVSPPLLWLLRSLVRSRGFWAAGLRGAYVRRSAVDAALVDAYRRPSAVAGWDAGMLRFLASRLLPDTDDVAAMPFPPAAAALAALVAEGLPVLILHGDGDALVPPPNSGALAALAGGARLVVLRGVGHSPQEEAPEAFANAVAAFLEEALPKPDAAGTPRDSML